MKWLNGSKRSLVLVVYVAAIVLGGGNANAAMDNQPPVADAGSSRYAAEDPVQLDGTGSYDPDDSGPLSYAWRQIAGPSVVITDANTASPTVSGFTQTDEIQECEFELVLSDGELTSLPDTVKVIIVPTFGASTFRQENPPFDPDKPTVIFFGGGDCVTGGSSWSSTDWAGWEEKANIIIFPNYGPDSDARPPTYYRCGDVIIVYLSSVAPDYKQPIQTIGFSTGTEPAIDVGIHLNRIYRDARYAVNRMTDLDGGCRWTLQGVDFYWDIVDLFLTSAVDGEQCWIDIYYGSRNLHLFRDMVAVSLGLNHAGVRNWYRNSLTGNDMNNFNNGVVAGAYWSVIGPGKNLQLAPGTDAYYFRWDGDRQSGAMSFFLESQHPARLPEPVTLLAWRAPWLPDDDPNGILLTCEESENAVGYQVLSGSDPYNVANYNIVADSNFPPTVTAAMLPSSDTWWTIKARDAYGSTIYADPISVDSQAGPDTVATKLVDFNRDWKVDFKDFSMLVQHWHQHEPSVDIIPAANGDRIVDVKELTILAESWLKELQDPTLVAHWKLDETEGGIAHDSIGAKDGFGPPDLLWRPQGGKLSGALELDGIDDLLFTTFSLNPADVSFSVFAWVKGGAPGQVIISQTVGANWLLADSADGQLMTELQGTGRWDGPLSSQAVITDGDWHRVGLTWDGSNRILYVDDVEVARDTQTGLADSQGGLQIGAAKNLEPSSLWSGLIDDVRIYNRAVTP